MKREEATDRKLMDEAISKRWGPKLLGWKSKGKENNKTHTCKILIFERLTFIFLQEALEVFFILRQLKNIIKKKFLNNNAKKEKNKKSNKHKQPII